MQTANNLIIRAAERVSARAEELDALIAAPENLADRTLWLRFAKEKSALQPIVDCYRRLRGAMDSLEALEREVLPEQDDALKRLLTDEMRVTEAKTEACLAELKRLLVGDCADRRGAVLELRAEDGAARYAEAMTDMYLAYARSRGYRAEQGNTRVAASGGYTYARCRIDGGFNELSGEAGEHRFLIATTGGTTSLSVEVTVLPQAEREDTDVPQKDIRIDVYHSGGAGGQNVNKVETAIRVVHLPTGITVTCQDERSQLKNKERALNTLRERLTAERKKRQEAEQKQLLAQQKNRGLERLYDCVSNTVTSADKMVVKDLNAVLNGDIGDFIYMNLLKTKISI